MVWDMTFWVWCREYLGVFGIFGIFNGIKGLFSSLVFALLVFQGAQEFWAKGLPFDWVLTVEVLMGFTQTILFYGLGDGAT